MDLQFGELVGKLRCQWPKHGFDYVFAFAEGGVHPFVNRVGCDQV